MTLMMMNTKMLPPKSIPAMMISGLPKSPTIIYPARNSISSTSGINSMPLCSSQPRPFLMNRSKAAYLMIFRIISALPA